VKPCVSVTLPAEVVTTTSAAPTVLLGGVVAVIVVESTPTTSVAGIPPTVTDCTPPRDWPLIVIGVPPAIVPTLGATIVMTAGQVGPHSESRIPRSTPSTTPSPLRSLGAHCDEAEDVIPRLATSTPSTDHPRHCAAFRLMTFDLQFSATKVGATKDGRKECNRSRPDDRRISPRPAWPTCSAALGTRDLDLAVVAARPQPVEGITNFGQIQRGVRKFARSTSPASFIEPG
jgi:hypothetical protein